jgi:hypothetical protein
MTIIYMMITFTEFVADVNARQLMGMVTMFMLLLLASCGVLATVSGTLAALKRKYCHTVCRKKPSKPQKLFSEIGPDSH